MRPRLTSARTRATAVAATVALIAHLLAVPVHAGQPAAATAQVAAGRPNAEITQVVFNRGVVTITYDLVAPGAQGTFDVTLEVSTNGGQTYDVQPRSTNGDIGPTVSVGRGKRVVWEAAKDVESLQTDQFRFRVVIQVVMRPDNPVAAPPAESSQTRPGVQPPPVAPPPTATPARQAPTGNRLLWPGLAMFGAGATVAALGGAGPLRTKNAYVGFYELAPNKPAMYGGIGVAATGLVLLLLGRRGTSNTVSVAPIPGGVMLYRAATF